MCFSHGKSLVELQYTSASLTKYMYMYDSVVDVVIYVTRLVITPQNYLGTKCACSLNMSKQGLAQRIGSRHTILQNIGLNEDRLFYVMSHRD